MKGLHLFFILSGISVTSQAQQGIRPDYVVEKEIFSDDFSNGLNTEIWKTEIDPQPNSSVYVREGKLFLDTRGGVTVWLNKKLEGNLIIVYNRTVLKDTGRNDRVSDLNNFWMASDPRNANLFTRSGVLQQYDSLKLYYVGMGGNTNRTTRFRKYTGTGERKLLQEYTDAAHLLQPNKTYTITLLVMNGMVQYLVDGNLYFSFTDPDPLTGGYFGFRSTKSRQVIDDLHVYRIKPL